ncbi:uncharacterized protein TNCV_1033781 [Trichonephila clavipes]|nr:uncharacterized protein TNCV_1033781 [Trichonephila clavipes]
MAPQINTRGGRVLQAMARHTIIPAVGAVYRCKAEAGLRRSPRVQFPCAWHHTKRRSRWVGVNGSTRNGRRDPKCLSARRLCMVREYTGAPSEGATCAWMAADEAVGCTRAFPAMWRSSRRLVCRGRPEPRLHPSVTKWQWTHSLFVMSSSLVPLKIRSGLKHVTSVVALSPPVGVTWYGSMKSGAPALV